MGTFDGKNVLVVGGSSGIGKATVLKLREQGTEVYNVSRSSCQIQGVTDIGLDVLSDFSAIEGLPDRLDGLVYCPGSIHLKPFQSLKIDDFLRDFEINVLGAVKVLKACLRNLRAAERSSVTLFSTVAVAQGMTFHSSVAASKGAIEGLVKSLAAEWSRSGIRVNAIAPSLTDTPMARNLLSTDEKRKASEERHPLKGISTAEELAGTVIYLLSDAAQRVTGQVMHVDGGMSSIRPL
ncbi:SDR family NAD(P)-dependent oxidoreductase [Marinoscillum sp.]|uniref:SDR family NAD(P)-dependent oxidoreductase n=1 Tax=Marinoscillum sp. TaxID=2024838 RepID=UPI003BAA40B9